MRCNHWTISTEGHGNRLAHKVIRAILFTALASALVVYPYWVYRRVELSITGSGWLALIRASVLVTILGLLFDLQIPVGDSTKAMGERWVLLDTSLSMLACC